MGDHKKTVIQYMKYDIVVNYGKLTMAYRYSEPQPCGWVETSHFLCQLELENDHNQKMII